MLMHEPECAHDSMRMMNIFFSLIFAAFFTNLFSENNGKKKQKSESFL